MKCIYCNNDIMDNSNTCPHCGCIQPKKGNILPLIIIIVFILLACGTVVTYYFSSNKTMTYSNNEEKEIIENDRDNEVIQGPGTTNDDTNNDNNNNNNNNNTPTVSRNEIKVYEFYGATCSYCMALNTWFQSIESEYGQYYELVQYEVWSNTENQELMYDVADYLNITVSGVPFVVIGNKYTLGFSETTTPNIIINYIMEEYNKNDSERVDVVKEVKNK